jgi:hypothetical protein
VEAAIAEAKNARSARTAITADEVLREFTKVGRSDVRRLFSELGALKPIHELDDETAAAIASIEVVTKRLPGADGTAVVAASARTSNVNLGSENQSAAIGAAAAIMSDVRRARTA